uniref:Uncharacterized protein n=1 Tax=Pseudomonas phage HRDY3 TaxID=3236930 RepID=A0AB39CDG0_9VIRU
MAKSKSAIAEAMVRKRNAMWNTLMVLKRLVEGAAPDRDHNVVDFVNGMRKKILVLDHNWLPKKLFHEQPPNLFWVEGDSKHVLYNYIPRGGRNVYQVAYTNVLVNASRAMMYLNWAKAEDVWALACCKFVCEKTQIFETDLVWTVDPVLREWHRDRIEFFAPKYTQQPKEQQCNRMTQQQTNVEQPEQQGKST